MKVVFLQNKTDYASILSSFAQFVRILWCPVEKLFVLWASTDCICQQYRSGDSRRNDTDFKYLTGWLSQHPGKQVQSMSAHR